MKTLLLISAFLMQTVYAQYTCYEGRFEANMNFKLSELKSYKGGIKTTTTVHRNTKIHYNIDNMDLKETMLLTKMASGKYGPEEKQALSKGFVLVAYSSGGPLGSEFKKEANREIRRDSRKYFKIDPEEAQRWEDKLLNYLASIGESKDDLEKYCQTDYFSFQSTGKYGGKMEGYKYRGTGINNYGQTVGIYDAQYSPISYRLNIAPCVRIYAYHPDAAACVLENIKENERRNAQKEWILKSKFGRKWKSKWRKLSYKKKQKLTYQLGIPKEIPQYKLR